MKTIMNEKLSISESNPIRARHYDYDHFTYPWHFHSEYEIIYVKESTGHRFVGDSIEEYSGGDLILLGSNLPHYMRSSPIYMAENETLRVKGTIIQFEKDFMNHSIANYPQFVQIKNLLEESRRGIHFPYPYSKEIIGQLERIPSANGILQITSLLLLLQEMAVFTEKRLLASPNFHESLSSFGNSRIEKIMSYLNDHYTRNISLKEISSLAAMNPTAFCRYFKENTGKTFMQYITEMRVGYACKLLKAKDMSISHISMECGFDCIIHFNRTFKKLTGFTPSGYKEQMSV